MYFVYVWQGYKKNWYSNNIRITKQYIGSTQNLHQRLQQHKYNCRKHKKLYCANIIPQSIHYIHIESYTTRRQAVRREKWLKSHQGKKWLYKNIPDYV